MHISYQDFEIIITRDDKNQLIADLGTATGGQQLTQPIHTTLPSDYVAWIEAGQGRKSKAELADLLHKEKLTIIFVIATMFIVKRVL